MDTSYTKFDVGTYQYSNNNHAVSGISPLAAGYSPAAYSIAHASFNRPTQITQGTQTLNISYSPGKQRNKSVYTDGSATVTRYYNGTYEKEVNGSTTKEYDYVYSPEGLAAIAVKTGSTRVIYYAHTDHLGSLRVLTNSSKAVVSGYRYDAWGKRTLVAGTNITNRGFTMHEHLEEFGGILNCNARLYDPVLGRFLAPDPYVADETYSQDFNRYTYARNNPLVFTDPSGEISLLGWAIVAYFTYQGAKQGKEVANSKGYGSGDWQTYAYMTGYSHIRAGQAYIALAGLPNVPGIIPNGLLQSGMQIGLNGVYNYADGNPFFDNWQKSALIGFASGALSGYQLAKANGLNLLTGQIPLETKLEMLLDENYDELMSEIGEAGVRDVYLGNRKNLEGTGFKNSGGDLLDTRDGRAANGFLDRGNYYGNTSGGYNKLNNNDIYLSKNTVRRMWRGNLGARETLFHEWFHARDYYTGLADFYFKQYGSDYHNILESRAHGFNYLRYRTEDRYFWYMKYLKLVPNFLK